MVPLPAPYLISCGTPATLDIGGGVHALAYLVLAITVASVGHGRVAEFHVGGPETLEQLGDRAGMARSFSQIGVLYTQMRRTAAAVPLNLRSLALRQQMQNPALISTGSPASGRYWAHAFRDIVAEHSDIESTTHVLALVDDFDRRQTPAADAKHPPLA
jgi:hypothetical protein